MKNTYSKLLILVILTCSTVIFGCKKDDETEKNQITFDSNKYSLSKGYQSLVSTINHNFPKSSVYEFDLMLTGSGLSYDSDKKSFSGQGDYLFLKLYSLASESLTEGLYTFDRFSSRDSLTINYGVVGIDAVFAFYLSDSEVIISSGVVEVKKTGDVYQIDFDLYTDENQQIVGSYSGTLDNFILENENGLYNNLNFQSTNYPLNYGTLDLIDEASYNPLTYEYDLFLTGSGFTYDLDFGELVGKGNLIGLKIFSTSPDSLKTGTYVFDEIITMAPFTFIFAAVGIDYDLSSDSEEGLFIIKSGTIKISRIKNKYVIIFDVITSSDIQAKGQYYGVLDYHNYFSKRKSMHYPFPFNVH
ncbi:MAG: hypothetical protein EHM93_16835 [Bacteroidales bacterium]|nr:MAG: hypothetical protein EHM93_16835 [Bacteroidales bacterium]